MEQLPSDPEPEIKYLVEDICEAYQDGVALWDQRVERLDLGRDGEAARALRKSLEGAGGDIGAAYKRYYKQAGKHFAFGNITIQDELTRFLHLFTIQIVEVLQHSHDDALACIPVLPGSFQRYTPINYALLHQKSGWVRSSVLHALNQLFEKISEWAVPLHTLPPLASPPTTSATPDAAEPDTGSFLDKIRAPFHRQRYEYEELPDPYSFRLVKIDSARPYVICEIQIFQLTSPPAFHALSYCWGKYGQNSDIWCNERVFKVSSNLKKGLQRLWKFGRWSRVQWFWIDQICIDQKNFAERMQQVRLMRAIYQRAQNTVIWLGPDDGSARDAFSLITDLYQLSRKSQRNERRPFTKGQPLAITESLSPSDDDPRWNLLSQFLNLPWFERCWIIQEVVVSQGDPVLLCGGFQTLWSRFQEGMEWLDIAGSVRNLSAERIRLVKGIFELTSTKDVWKLQSLLHSTRPFQATDPRDKVFALLGLAGESRAPDRWPKALMPNYDRSTRNVYTEVTLYCIQKTESLSILSQVGTSHPSDGNNGNGPTFPSWVPRWDLPPSTNSLSAYATVQIGDDWRLLVEKYNNASKDLPVSLDVYSPPDVLRLEGIRVSAVEFCLPPVSPDYTSANSSTATNIQPKLLKTIPELYEVCQLHLSHLAPNDILKTFAIVTTAGLTSKQEDARQDPMHTLHARAFLTSVLVPNTPESEHHGSNSMYSVRTALRSNLSISTLTPSISPPPSIDSLHTPPLHHSRFRSRSSPNASGSLSNTAAAPSTPNYGTRAADSPFEEEQVHAARYTSALSPLLHRRLFVTSKGQLGLGPASMMSGDMIAVLFGGRVPFVLRRVVGEGEAESWRLVGECYVDGVAGGEIIHGRARGEGVDHEWFDLI